MNALAPFHDRADAGKKLADKLSRYKKDPRAIVLALPRGGVPVAYEIATKLDLPLDLMLVRKLGVPGNEELAVGALAMGNVRVFNQDVIQGYGVSQDVINRISAKENEEIDRRNELYRNGKPAPILENRTVILVDDGIATGATARAAILAVRHRNPSQVILAVPVVSEDTYQALRQEVDQVVSLLIPKILFAVGSFYEDFRQVKDEEVIAFLKEARHEE